MLDINLFQKNSRSLDEGQKDLTKNAGEISNDMEGLQVALHKMQRASAEGKQVVPGSAPEVVQQYDNEKILAGTVGHGRSWYRLLNRKIHRTRIIWAAMLLSIFVIGVGLGCAIIKSIESRRKGQLSVGVQTISATETSFLSSTELSQLTTSSSTMLNTTTNSLTGSPSVRTMPLTKATNTFPFISSSSASTSAAAATSRATSGPSQNLQTFTGNLGGALADPITNTGNSDRPYQIPSGETFTKLSDAVQQSCANQFNTCQKAAAGPGGGGGGGVGAGAPAGAVTVSACTDQQIQCKSTITTTVPYNPYTQSAS